MDAYNSKAHVDVERGNILFRDSLVKISINKGSQCQDSVCSHLCIKYSKLLKVPVLEKRVCENVRMMHQFYVYCHSTLIEVLYISFKFQSKTFYIPDFSLKRYIIVFEVTIKINVIFKRIIILSKVFFIFKNRSLIKNTCTQDQSG